MLAGEGRGGDAWHPEKFSSTLKIAANPESAAVPRFPGSRDGLMRDAAASAAATALAPLGFPQNSSTILPSQARGRDGGGGCGAVPVLESALEGWRVRISQHPRGIPWHPQHPGYPSAFHGHARAFLGIPQYLWDILKHPKASWGIPQHPRVSHSTPEGSRTRIPGGIPPQNSLSGTDRIDLPR